MALMYGVWIPRNGWLKENGKTIAFESKTVAESVAKRMGKKARVEFIDEALSDLEQQLLDAEKYKHENKWWRLLVRRVKHALPAKST